jgi:hypothetical protein
MKEHPSFPSDLNQFLKVITLPAHKGAQNILPQGQFSLLGGRAIDKNLPGLYPVTFVHKGTLVNASSLISAHKLH